METKKQYFAKFNAHDTCCCVMPYKDTNKDRLVNVVREMAEYYAKTSGDCYWVVYDEEKTIVADGGLSNGKRWKNSPIVGMKMSEVFE